MNPVYFNRDHRERPRSADSSSVTACGRPTNLLPRTKRTRILHMDDEALFPACVQGKSRKRKLPPAIAPQRPADPPFVLPQLPNLNGKSAMNGAIAGAWAGLVAESALHPFDTVSTRLKAQVMSPPKYTGFLHACKTIVSEEGVRGLYGGIGATLLFQGPSTAIYFGTYELVKEASTSIVPQQYEPVVHLTAGAVSELANSVVVVPMEVVKSRLQLGRNPSATTGGWIRTQHNYRNTLHAIVSIVRAEGIGGLYSGYRACLALDCAFSALQFAIYEQLKAATLSYYGTNPNIVSSDSAVPTAATPETASSTTQTGESSSNSISPPTSTPTLQSWVILTIGGFAGGTAALLTNPLDVVTARLMVQGSKPSEADGHLHGGTFRGISHCLRETFKHEGMGGFWKGSVPRVLSIAPLVALQFMVYEGIKNYLNLNMDEFELE